MLRNRNKQTTAWLQGRESETLFARQQIENFAFMLNPLQLALHSFYVEIMEHIVKGHIPDSTDKTREIWEGMRGLMVEQKQKLLFSVLSFWYMKIIYH